MEDYNLTEFYELRVYVGGEWRIVGPEHDIVTDLHTAVGVAQWNLVSATGSNTVGWLLARNDPGILASVLRTNNDGHLSLVQLNTDTIKDKGGSDISISPTGDIKLNPTGAQIRVMPSHTIQSDNFASQTTGWGIDYAGGGDFRYLFADELHAKSFIADLEQALAGGQIICKSVAVLYSTFTAPAAGGVTTLTVRDLPSATGMAVFVNGDIVLVRTFSRSGGGLTISNCWGTVTLDTAYGINGFDSATKTQRYTFTRSSAPNAGSMAQGTSVYADSIILDYGMTGNGFYEVNAIDGVYGVNSPYAQVVTWTDHPATGQVVRSRYGNLKGITAVTGEYGIVAGDGFSSTAKYIKASTEGVEVHNADLKVVKSSANVILLDNNTPYISVGNPAPTAYGTGVGFWAGNHSGTYKVRIGDPATEYVAWDGASIKFFNNTTQMAELSGTTWTLGNVANGNILISSSSVQIRQGTTVYTDLSSGTLRLGDATGERLTYDGTDLAIYDGGSNLVFRAGGSGNFMSSLLISESLGQLLFTQTSGMALWGPSCTLSQTGWSSSRGQLAALSGGFRTGQGRWAGSRALQVTRSIVNIVPNPNLGGTYVSGVAPSWAKGGTLTSLTCTESSEFRLFGSKCQKLVFTNGATQPYFTSSGITVAATTEYTWQVWLYIESLTTSVRVRCRKGTTSDYTDTSLTTTGLHRVEVTQTTVSGTNGEIIVYPPSNDAATVYLLGSQVEIIGYGTPLASGDMGSGYTWAGTAYASSTSRAYTTAIVGLGGVINTGSGSIIVDFRPHAIGTGGNFLFSAGDSNAEFDAYISTAGEVVFRINGSARVTGGTVADGQESQAVFTWNVSSNESKVYLNGELVNTGTCGGGAWTPHASLYIGGTPASTALPLNGWISQFATFGTVLSADQVASVYASNSPLVDSGVSMRPGIHILDGEFSLSTATSGALVKVDTSGIASYDSSGTQRVSILNDGSGWLGASDVFAWNTGGVVAFKANGLIQPWETPSLYAALMLGNKYGGGVRRWAWDACSHRLNSGSGWDILSGYSTDATTPSNWKVNTWGAPYVEFNGTDMDLRCTSEQSWMDIGAYSYMVWVWVRADTLATTHRVILGKWDAIRVNRRSYLLYWDVTQGKLGFSISSNGTDEIAAFSSISETTGVWYFIAGTYNPSTSVRIYVGAASSGSLTMTENTTGIPSSVYDSMSNLMWGGANESESYSTWFWDGQISVCAAYQACPASTAGDYLDLIFRQTKQFYGG